MEEKGWRGLIYDAPWAKFKSGQTGVIISDDRKECETLSDDIHSIKLDFDPNTTFSTREGHILFRQKGSDLFDVVCITQEPGGDYKLEITTNKINGCDGDCNTKWAEFLNAVSVFEVINGERHEITGRDKELVIVYPTKAQACKNNCELLTNTGTTNDKIIPVSGVTSYNKEGVITAECITTIAIAKRGESTREFTNESIWNFDSVKLKVEETAGVCPTIVARNGTRKISCNGGEVQFDLTTTQNSCNISVGYDTLDTQTCKRTVLFIANESQTTKNYVLYGLKNISVKHIFIVKGGCDEQPTSEQVNGVVISYTITTQGVNITNINQENGEITFTVDSSVRNITLRAVSEMGTVGTHTISLNNLTRNA